MAAQTARLLISCPDRKGIIAAVADFIARHDGNILEADQHTDPVHGAFFMRVEDMIRKGRDLERMVLTTAVRHHVEDKVLVNQNRTVVFD